MVTFWEVLRSRQRTGISLSIYLGLGSFSRPLHASFPLFLEHHGVNPFQYDALPHHGLKINEVKDHGQKSLKTEDKIKLLSTIPVRCFIIVMRKVTNTAINLPRALMEREQALKIGG